MMSRRQFIKTSIGATGVVLSTALLMPGWALAQGVDKTPLHLLGVTSDGKLWHTIRQSDGTWTPFGDVKAQAGDRGTFVRVGIAVEPAPGPAEFISELHVGGVTSDGKLWHTIRHSDGTWTPFGDVKAQAGDRGTFVDVGDAGTPSIDLHVSGPTSDGKLWHTIRHSDGTWTPFGDVKAQAGDPGSVQSISVAT